MASLIQSITKLGENLVLFLSSNNALYVIYFFAFFFTTFVLINTALQKGGKNPFVGKPGKVISLMISFIVTGAVFYGKSALEIILSFNNVGGFIFTLFFALGFVGAGIWLFKKNKENNFNLAMFSLSFFVYIASSLMLPHFLSEMNGNSLLGGGGAVIFGAGGEVILNTLTWIVQISFLLLIFFGLKYVFKLIFGNDDSTNSFTNTNSKQSDAHAKRITDFKSLLGALLSELKDVNNHFNNKINLLNNLRVEIGKLREYDKGGRK